MLEIKFKQLLKTLSINHKIILTFRFFIGNSLFLCVSESESIVFAEFDHKKMGRTFSRIPFFIFHGRGLFLPSHRLAILESLRSNFNIIFRVVYHKVEILATVKRHNSNSFNA